MANDHQHPQPNSAGQPHRWPWFVLGAVLLAIVLAVLWMSREIERTRRLRDLNTPPLHPPPLTEHCRSHKLLLPCSHLGVFQWFVLNPRAGRE